MKLLRLLPLLLLSAVFFTACQKDLSFEEGQSTGTLKDDGTGDCLPVDIKGTYTKDVALDATNYVDIEADVSQTGSYLIKSDTLNGYSLSALGNFAVTGTQTIRLLASGQPIAAGVDVFTIEFGGTTCEVNIVVNGAPATTADFTFGSTGGVCTGATLNGTYTQGLVMDPATNTAVLNVNVVTAGTYLISIPTAVNGVTFSGSGTFAATGAQTVTLAASGTPAASGTFNYPVTAGTSSCGFDITFAAASTTAVYTLNCSTPAFAGTYQMGAPTTTANTMTVSVNVTSGGTYSITTNLQNGVSFSGSGTLPATPATQNVTLTATGTPLAAGTFTYTLTGTSTPATTCTVPVTYIPLALSNYTLNCPSIVVNGILQVGVPANASNTITLTVTVATPGLYNILSVPLLPGGGVSFQSPTGSFPATPAVQSVTLNCIGTPTVAGVYSLTLVTTSPTPSSCTIPITVLP